MVERIPKINLHGIFSETNGWSRHAEGFAMALSQYADLELEDWGEADQYRDKPSGIEDLISRGSLDDCADWGIGIGPMEYMEKIVGVRKIASIVWETTKIPTEKKKYITDRDQIWVPSRWGKELMISNGFSEDIVKVVPEGVDTDFFKPLDVDKDRTDGLYRFLCVGKWEERKGLEDLVHTYCEVFSNKEPVELLLLTHNRYLPKSKNREIIKRIHDSYARCPKLTFLNPLRDEEMVKLYNSVDSFVLPTKAEAWGLPIIEAMSCELPVIVTNYSGHTEYASDDTAYLVDISEMVRVYDPVFFNQEGDYGFWAQPDLDHLGYLMRKVFTDREEAKLKGARSRIEVVENWTWDAAARKAIEALGI